jgi:predicted RNase H-like nuclease
VENGDSLDIVAVDIPIGLNEEYEAGGRFCDREARKCLLAIAAPITRSVSTAIGPSGWR